MLIELIKAEKNPIESELTTFRFHSHATEDATETRWNILNDCQASLVILIDAIRRISVIQRYTSICETTR